jgi:hypothetical protein
VSFINNGFPAVRFMETFECSPSPVDNTCGILPLPCPPPAQIPNFDSSQHASPDGSLLAGSSVFGGSLLKNSTWRPCPSPFLWQRIPSCHSRNKCSD